MRALPGKATLIALLALLIFSCPAAAQTKVYRGSIGNSHIQMRLNFNGSEISGTYAYDSNGQDLNLTGHINNGALELTEISGKQKTGKFVCKKPLENLIDSECAWSKIEDRKSTRLNSSHLGI